MTYKQELLASTGNPIVDAEMRMGEEAPNGVHSREDDRQKTCPSPTREELVEVMCKSYNRDMTAREALCAALDALIACGAVKVREASNG